MRGPQRERTHHRWGPACRSTSTSTPWFEVTCALTTNARSPTLHFICASERLSMEAWWRLPSSWHELPYAMAKRERDTPGAFVALIPWWAWAVLAVLSFLLFSWLVTPSGGGS